MDNAMALKVAMIKAREQQWRRIEVGIPQRQLMRMIETNKTRDMRLFSHLQYVKDLSSMFVRCSYVLARNEISVRTTNICDHALSMSLLMRSGYFLSAFRHLYSSNGAFAHYVYSSYRNLIKSSIVSGGKKKVSCVHKRSRGRLG